MAKIKLVSKDKTITVEVWGESVVFKVEHGITFYWPVQEWGALDKYVRAELAEKET